MRKLATVQQIAELRPIEGADAIEVARINGWDIVVKKGDFKVEEMVVFCEVDSFLPIKPEYEFLRKSSYKKMPDGTEGFRLKTIKLRGQLSQGLLINYQTLISKIPPDENGHINLPDMGEDVTEILGITKYESPIPACLSGLVKGNFPSFIPKTDEERVQNLSEAYNTYKQNKFYVTEKLDGSSMTCYLHNDEFGVCSRRVDLKETEDNSYWISARLEKIEEKMRANFLHNIAFQGELIGPGIQGNRYKVVGKPQLHIFNMYNIMNGEFYHADIMIETCKALGLKHVPILYHHFPLPDTVEDLIQYAEGKSVLAPDVEREGVVVRTYSKGISFKAISNKYLLKNED